jgi:hypothetical protein
MFAKCEVHINLISMIKRYNSNDILNAKFLIHDVKQPMSH